MNAMKKISTLSALIFLLVSCKSEDPIAPPKPTAEIDVRMSWGGPANTETMLVMGTHDITLLSSTVTNADSILWDFGNGVRSREKIVTVVYDEKGTYNLTLTAFGKGGEKSVATKAMNVKERVVTGFVIDKLYMNDFAKSQSGLPVFSKLDLWIELKFSQTTPPWTDNHDVIAPTIYKSPVFTQVDSSFHSAITYALPHPNDIVINYPVNNSDYSQGPGLIANLYGKDNSGTYLLLSSAWSGFYILNAANPAFSFDYGLQLTFGSGAQLKLDCQFQ
jgi:PKD repeat protein